MVKSGLDGLIGFALTEMEGAVKVLQKELFVCSLAAPFELFSGCKKLLEQNNRKLK